MTTSNITLTGTLKALIKYSKSTNNQTWKSIRDDVLSSIYHPDMTLDDVVSIVLAAYSEAICIPQLKMGSPDFKLRELMLAPIKGHHSIELLNYSSIDAKYSVEQWYNSMIGHMMSELRVSVVDWCKDEIWGEN